MHLATKVGLVVSDAGVTVDLSPKTIVAQSTESLERLGASRVDFCLAHASDLATSIEATLEGFAEVINRGWVSRVGACNLSAAQLTAASQASARLGLPRYKWAQNEYNLLHCKDEQKSSGLCAAQGWATRRTRR